MEQMEELKILLSNAGITAWVKMVEAMCRFLQVETVHGSHENNRRITNCTDPQSVETVEFFQVIKFTDPSWWKQWNFSGPQNLQTPVGGGHGISPGHKFTDPSWWRLWNYTGSQILLTPVGGGCGILPGHKFY
jgi:hypothetical protein